MALKPVAARLPAAAAAAAAAEFSVSASDIVNGRDKLKKVETVAAKVSRDGTATMAFKNGERHSMHALARASSQPHRQRFMCDPFLPFPLPPPAGLANIRRAHAPDEFTGTQE